MFQIGPRAIHPSLMPRNYGLLTRRTTSRAVVHRQARLPAEPVISYMFTTDAAPSRSRPRQSGFRSICERKRAAARCIFTTYQPKGVARDVADMIGLYCRGSQRINKRLISMLMQTPWKLVRDITRLMYGSDKYGLTALTAWMAEGSVASW